MRNTFAKKTRVRPTTDGRRAKRAAVAAATTTASTTPAAAAATPKSNTKTTQAQIPNRDQLMSKDSSEARSSQIREEDSMTNSTFTSSDVSSAAHRIHEDECHAGLIDKGVLLPLGMSGSPDGKPSVDEAVLLATSQLPKRKASGGSRPSPPSPSSLEENLVRIMKSGESIIPFILERQRMRENDQGDQFELERRTLSMDGDSPSRPPSRVDLDQAYAESDSASLGFKIRGRALSSFSSVSSYSSAPVSESNTIREDDGLKVDLRWLRVAEQSVRNEVHSVDLPQRPLRRLEPSSNASARHKNNEHSFVDFLGTLMDGVCGGTCSAWEKT